MRVSEVLSEGVEQFLEFAPGVQAHMENMDNPHNVTKGTLGLENVTNDRQAKASDFSSHKEAPELDHPAKSVTGGKLADGAVTTRALAQKAVTAEKIASGAVDAGAIKEKSVGYRHMESTVQEDIAAKVDKVEGMGLSQNNFTDADRNKLSTIKLTGEDGSYEINTETLLTKDFPVQLYKTGNIYKYYGDLDVGKNAESILGTEWDEANGDFIIPYKDKYGLLNFYWVDGTGTAYTASVSGDTVSYCLYHGYLFFATLQGNVVTVKRRSFGAGAAAMDVGTFTLTKTGDIEIKKIYSNSTSSLSGNIWIVYYVHTSSTTTLMVENFAIGGDGAPLWSYTQSMKAKANFTPPLSANDTVYDPRINMTAMDLDQNLYVSVVNKSVEDDTCGVIRLSLEGEVTGRFIPVTATANSQIYQDIAIVDEKLYAFANTCVVMVDLVTEKMCTIWKGKTARLRGLTPASDGVHIVTETTDGTTTLYYIQGGRRMDCASSKKPERQSQFVSGQYYLCRYLEDKLYLLQLDTETKILKAKLYVPCSSNMAM